MEDQDVQEHQEMMAILDMQDAQERLETRVTAVERDQLVHVDMREQREKQEAPSVELGKLVRQDTRDQMEQMEHVAEMELQADLVSPAERALLEMLAGLDQDPKDQGEILACQEAQDAWERTLPQELTALPDARDPMGITELTAGQELMASGACPDTLDVTGSLDTRITAADQ